MAARAGMGDIIAALRGETDTEENAVTINGVAYWTDDQLQEVLDRYSQDVYTILQATPLKENGSTVYKRYYLPPELGKDNAFLEGDETSGAFVLRDSRGYAVSDSLYTYYGSRKLVEFNSNQNNKTFILEARLFDLFKAAAHVWNMKADFRTALITIKAGGHQLFEDQEYLHCIQMRDYYRSRQGISVSRMKGVGYGI